MAHLTLDIVIFCAAVAAAVGLIQVCGMSVGGALAGVVLYGTSALFED